MSKGELARHPKQGHGTEKQRLDIQPFCDTSIRQLPVTTCQFSVTVPAHLHIAANMAAMEEEEERRVFLEGIPFMMNECFLRFILETEDLVSPEKVVIQRRGEHTSQWQWANAFLWFRSQKVALQVARLLDGYKLQGWYKIWKASLAKTDPQWKGYPTLSCIFWDNVSYGCFVSFSMLLYSCLGSQGQLH